VLSPTTANSIELWQAANEVGGGTVLVCGIGFDPRTMHTAELVSRHLEKVEVLALGLPGSGETSAISALAAGNHERLEELFGESLHVIPPVQVEDRSAAGVVLTRQLVRDHNLLAAGHVLIDLSALPSALSFPLVHMLLAQAREGVTPSFEGQLQVVVSENPRTDARIVPTGLDEPDTLAGFSRLPDDNQTRIWVPVLGEGRSEPLRAIREFLQPNEVCPVLPFPAQDPRRADNLLLEHRALLFDEVSFEPGNVLHAAESNPFDLYRQLGQLAHRYRRALEPLGGAAIVVSQHASKLLSLGVLLAAHEFELAVAHVRPTGYELVEGPASEPDGDAKGDPQLFTTWLTGLPYEQ